MIDVTYDANYQLCPFLDIFLAHSYSETLKIESIFRSIDYYLFLMSDGKIPLFELEVIIRLSNCELH